MYWASSSVNLSNIILWISCKFYWWWTLFCLFLKWKWTFLNGLRIVMSSLEFLSQPKCWLPGGLGGSTSLYEMNIISVSKHAPMECGLLNNFVDLIWFFSIIYFTCILYWQYCIGLLIFVTFSFQLWLSYIVSRWLLHNRL